MTNMIWATLQEYTNEIKEVYVDKDGTTTTIWEAPEEEQKAYLSEEHTEPLG